MEPEMKELVETVKQFALEDGYEIVDVLMSDFGKTVKMIVKKDEHEYVALIVQEFCSTDSDGKKINYFGKIDIRDTPWFKSKLEKESQHG